MIFNYFKDKMYKYTVELFLNNSLFNKLNDYLILIMIITMQLIWVVIGIYLIFV